MSQKPVSFRFSVEEMELIDHLKEEFGISDMFGGDKRIIVEGLRQLELALHNYAPPSIRELYRRMNEPVRRKKSTGRPRKPVIRNTSDIEL